MTKLQATLASIGTAVLGLAVMLVGAFAIKNKALVDIGFLLLGTGAGGLGIPRPQDATSTPTNPTV